MATLTKNGQRWVPILDPPIHIKPGYAAYDTGIAQDVFIKDITGNNYIGQVSLQTLGCTSTTMRRSPPSPTAQYTRWLMYPIGEHSCRGSTLSDA